MSKITMPQAIAGIFIVLFLAYMGLYAYQRATLVIPPMPEAPVISLSGKLVPGGAKCPLLQSEDGKTYALKAPGALLTGTRLGKFISIKGTLQEANPCLQGEATVLLSEVSIPNQIGLSGN